MNNKLSREKLVKQLKAISQESDPEQPVRGIAMCYMFAPHHIEIPQKHIASSPRKKIVRCNKCRKLFMFNDWERNEIKKCVKRMSRMGCDVKVESFCMDCCKELKEELYPSIDEKITIDEEHIIDLSLDKRNYVFYFRTNSNEAYHRAIANDSLYYHYVLAFLDVASHQGYVSIENNFLAKQIHIIEYMTGLKVDEALEALSWPFLIL